MSVSITLEVLRSGRVEFSFRAPDEDRSDYVAHVVLRVQHHSCSLAADRVRAFKATLWQSTLHVAGSMLALLEEVRPCQVAVSGQRRLYGEWCARGVLESRLLSGLTRKGFLGSAGCSCHCQGAFLFKPCNACKAESTLGDVAVWQQLTESSVGEGHRG